MLDNNAAIKLTLLDNNAAIKLTLLDNNVAIKLFLLDNNAATKRIFLISSAFYAPDRRMLIAYGIIVSKSKLSKIPYSKILYCAIIQIV